MIEAQVAWWIGLVTLVTICSGLVWWLFFSPIDDAASSASGGLSQRTLSFAIGVYFVLGTGGIWDASWHMRYGIAGTIRDFWSPPHLLMYASFGVLAGFTAFALSALMRGTGGIRVRFRA